MSFVKVICSKTEFFFVVFTCKFCQDWKWSNHKMTDYFCSSCQFINFQDSVMIFIIPHGLVARIPGSHPGGLGSIPGVGGMFFSFYDKIFTLNLPRIYRQYFVKYSSKMFEQYKDTFVISAMIINKYCIIHLLE